MFQCVQPDGVPGTLQFFQGVDRTPVYLTGDKKSYPCIIFFEKLNRLEPVVKITVIESQTQSPV
jgi:hypothetical protein